MTDQMLTQTQKYINRQMTTYGSTALWTNEIGGQTVTAGRRNPCLLKDLILQTETEKSIDQLVTEQGKVGNRLRSYGLEPHNRLLITGSSGNGKTVLAQAIANALEKPFVEVTHETVLGNYHRGTLQRLAEVFQQARTGSCVLFFDMFESWAKEHSNEPPLVGSLQNQIDGLPSYVVFVAATSYPELLAPSIRRRFQIRIDLPNPTREQIEEWLQRFQTGSERDFGIDPKDVAERLYGASFAELQNFGVDILRKVAIMRTPNVDIPQVVKEKLSQWEKQHSPTSDSNQTR